jgi:hypothetical protein
MIFASTIQCFHIASSKILDFLMCHLHAGVIVLCQVGGVAVKMVAMMIGCEVPSQ